MAETDLTVEIAGIRLRNPVLLASGTSGYGKELAPVIDLKRLGGIILKSVTVEPSKGNPEPRIWETSSGMLNSIGLENVGIDRLVDEVLPGIEDLGLPVFASIAGETVRAFARLGARLDGASGLAGIEINVSCPNVEKGGLQFGVDPSATKAVVMAVRENCSLPLFVKLSAAVTDVRRVAEAAGQAGAFGLSLINTLPGMAIDIERRKPRLGAVTGGLSGPAIKPVAIKAVWDCYRATGLPIIGGGGVYDAEDVVEFMLAGASVVALGSSIFQDPTRALLILDGLPAAIEKAGAESARSLTGALKV